MSTPPVIVEIDLKKKRLEEEIMQLERELHRKEKKQLKDEHLVKKDRSKITVSPLEDKTLTKSGFRETKESKPAIS